MTQSSTAPEPVELSVTRALETVPVGAIVISTATAPDFDGALLSSRS